MNTTTQYNVKFINCDYPEVPQPEFQCLDPEHVKHIVSALSAFYSGDECKCFINGEEAVLDNDWGLADPEESK